jgi:hypothetical protein
MTASLHRPSRSAALAALLLAAACGRGSDDSAGAEGAAWKKGQEWRLVPEAQIGGASAEGAAAFGSVVGLAVDALDRVWVADGQSQELRVFDARGNHVRTVGKKGAGPEEFGQIAGIDWGVDGNLWVMDGSNSRFAVYDTTGRLVTTHPRRNNMTMIPWPGGIDAEGRIYDVGASFAGGEGERIVRMGPDLQPRDTFDVPPFQGEYFEVTNTSGGRGGRQGRSIMRINVPFSGSQEWRVDPQGNVWVARTAQYRLERHGWDGAAPLVVERPTQPVKVAAEDRAQVLERYKDFTDRGGKIDESRIPATYPAIQSFFFSEDGHLWVIPVLGPDRTVVDVFDPSGTFLGRMTLPGRIVPSPAPAIRGSRFVGLVRDEDDVETVWVMRMEKPGR